VALATILREVFDELQGVTECFVKNWKLVWNCFSTKLSAVPCNKTVYFKWSDVGRHSKHIVEEVQVFNLISQF